MSEIGHRQRTAAIGYLRVSTTKQDATSQRTVIERYSAAAGIVIAEWIEETESGAKDWQARKLAEAVERGAVVVVSEVSRVARTLLGVLEFARDIGNKGGALHIANINITVDGSFNSQAMLTMMGLAAEWERSILIQRTRAGLDNAKAQAEQEGRTLARRGKSKKYKLDARAKEIDVLLAKGVGKSSIAKICEVSRQTLDDFLERKKQNEGND